MNDDVRARLESLEHRQALLRQELAALDASLAELKSGLSDKPLPQPPPIPDFAPPEVLSTPLPPPSMPEPLSPVPPPLPSPERPPETSLEMKVGTVWLARIGIVIVLTGLVFLGNYAWRSLVENFGAFAKLGLLYLAGGTLCALGLVLERGRESLRNYARVLLAGGLAAVYYTTYAAHYVPSLKIIDSPLLAGFLLVGLAGIIGWLADRRNSQATAGLAIILAFYASAANPLTYFTLCSNAILGVAAVILMVRRRWMIMPFLALAATYWSYLYWRLAESWKFWEVHGPDDADLTMRLAFLSIYWIVFTAGAFLSGGPKISGPTRVVFSTLNDAAFFSLAAIAISFTHHDSLWLIALIFGLFQSALAFTSRTIHGPGAPLASAWLAKALFFLTLALLLRFTGDSLAIILAVECSLLVFAAKQLPLRVLSIAGPAAGVLAMLAGMASLSGSGTAWAVGLAAILLLANGWFCGRAPAFSPRSITLSLCGMALAATVLVDRLPDEWEAAGPAFLGLIFAAGFPLHKCREWRFAGLLAAGMSGLIQLSLLESSMLWSSLVALGLLTGTAFTGTLFAREDKAARLLSGVLGVASALLFWAWVGIHLPESQQFWPVALVSLLILSISRGKPLRQALAAVLTLAAFVLFLGHGVGPQARFSAADLFGCLLLLGGERVARFAKTPVALARFEGLAGLAALLAWVTSGIQFFHNPIPLTAAWALLALGLFFAGFLMHARLFRLGGLGILALALCRIVLFDVWKLDPPLRILSFLILGGVLLVLGYLYNRYAERIRRWL